MLHIRCNTHYLYLYLHILYILSWYILAVVMSDLQRRNFILTVCVLVIRPCPTLVTPWTVAHQAPLSMGFSRQESWSGCHALLQGIFPTQGLNAGLLHGRWILYHVSHQEALEISTGHFSYYGESPTRNDMDNINGK